MPNNAHHPDDHRLTMFSFLQPVTTYAVHTQELLPEYSRQAAASKLLPFHFPRTYLLSKQLP